MFKNIKSFFEVMKLVKIVVFVPLSYVKKIREIIGKMGGGSLGNYDYCSFSSRGVSRFRPIKKAKPFIGKLNSLEEVEEERIEFFCLKSKAKEVIDRIREIHPYEEVALDIYPLISESELD